MQQPSQTRMAAAELLLELARHLRRQTHPVRQGDLTPEQFWLLKRLWIRGPLRVGELAAELGISAGSVTVACKRLERLGYVQRSRGQGGDERVVLVSLTESGRQRLQEWQMARRNYLLQLLARLEDPEITTLVSLLERLVTAAEADSEERYGSRDRQ